MRVAPGKEDGAEEGETGAHLDSPNGEAGRGKEAAGEIHWLPRRRGDVPHSSGWTYIRLPRGSAGCGTVGLAGVDVVAEHSVRGVEHGECSPADHVAIGEIASEEPVRAGVASLDQRGDDDVSVEGANHLHPH